MSPGCYDALMTLSVSAAIAGHVLSQGTSPWDLAPIIAAFVVPIVGLTVTLMRYQHLDSTKTRDLIERTAKETAKETAKQFERTGKETAKQFDLLRVDIGEIGRSLNDARERLARIEGRLDTIRPQHDGDDGENSRDAA